MKRQTRRASLFTPGCCCCFGTWLTLPLLLQAAADAEDDTRGTGANNGAIPNISQLAGGVARYQGGGGGAGGSSRHEHSRASQRTNQHGASMMAPSMYQGGHSAYNTGGQSMYGGPSFMSGEGREGSGRMAGVRGAVLPVGEQPGCCQNSRRALGMPPARPPLLALPTTTRLPPTTTT